MKIYRLNFKSIVILGFLISVMHFETAFAQKQCSSLFSSNYETALHENLFQLQVRDQLKLSTEEIRQKNSNTINELNTDNNLNDKKLLNKSAALKIFSDIRNSSSSPILNKYDRPEVKIGFCFGRAMYFHLALLRNNVPKSHIKKVWVIGPMKAAGIDWQFHVSTIVKLDDHKWYSLDTNESSLVEVSQWARKYANMGNGSVRVFITDPKKFTPTLHYDKIQLGLNLKPTEDWYNGYFQDMLTESRKINQMNLKKNVKNNFMNQMYKTMLDKLR